jgi:UDP-N-acetyl-D-galactosamine dehydrogenase
MTEKIAVVGLGYVGLPVAVALAARYDDVLGFDISQERIKELASGFDRTREIAEERLRQSTLNFSSVPASLAGRTMFIVTVPTPVDDERRPDLRPVEGSCRMIAPHLRPGALVVFESTVYPGVTEDVCGPLLEEGSGLRCGHDFFLGYSPERINPGDMVHRLETITKIVAAQDAPSVERMKAVYGRIVDAGLHVAPNIKVAEAAKVIENTQRDLNIALMNEIALIFDRMGIRTHDVLEAATTKWNFLPFRPGLVGGHCIGVDPYYLTAAAERVGYRPEVILAGRRINDAMGERIARKLIKLLAKGEQEIAGAKVAIFGLTFKENVPDLRNSKVPDIVAELREYGIEPLVHDPIADRAEAQREYGIELAQLDQCSELNGLILAVNHRAYVEMDSVRLFGLLRKGGVVIDVKSAFSAEAVPDGVAYWSL